VESSRKIHRVAWKIPIQLLPAILMRDPACWIAAATSALNPMPWRSGQSYLYRWIEAVESNGNPWRRIEDNSTPMYLEGLVAASTSASRATGSNTEGFWVLYSWSWSSCRPWKIDPDAYVEDPGRIEEEVSFILKDTPVDHEIVTTWSLMSCMYI